MKPAVPLQTAGGRSGVVFAVLSPSFVPSGEVFLTQRPRRFSQRNAKANCFALLIVRVLARREDFSRDTVCPASLSPFLLFPLSPGQAGRAVPLWLRLRHAAPVSKRKNPHEPSRQNCKPASYRKRHGCVGRPRVPRGGVGIFILPRLDAGLRGVFQRRPAWRAGGGVSSAARCFYWGVGRFELGGRQLGRGFA